MHDRPTYARFALIKRSVSVALVLVAGLVVGTARAASQQDVTSGPWRFAVGDGLSRAAATYDDSAWRSISVTKGWDSQGVGRFGFGWYRTTVHPSAQVRSAPLTTLHLEPAANTLLWVYVDGRLRGTSASNPAQVLLARSELPNRAVVIAVRAFCEAKEAVAGYNSCGLAGQVRLEPSSTAPKAMPISVSTNRVGNLSAPGRAISVYADVLNSTNAARRLSLGVAFGSRAPVYTTATVASGARHRFTTPFSSATRGPVPVTVTLSTNGTTLVTRTMSIGVADAPAKQDARFGLNTLRSARIAVALGTQDLGDPALAARAGASWLRVHQVPWKDVEAQPGRRDWDVMDAMHSAASAARLDVLWNVLGAPYWALGYPRPNEAAGIQSDFWCPPRPAFFPDFVRFHADAAARYRGDNWEIGNEPELPTNNYCWRFAQWGFQPAVGYSRLLAPTNAAINHSDPSARVVTAALETNATPGMGDPAFAARVMDSHAFDVFNVHVYADEGTMTASTGYRRAAAAKQMLAQRGLHAEVWGTEYGGNTGGDQSRQRLAATRLALQLLAGGADRVGFFYTVEYAGEPLPGQTLFDQAGGPLPALFSYLTMTRMLAGLAFTGVTAIDSVPALRFSNGTRSVTAIWDDNGRTIRVPPGVHGFTDWGNPVAHGKTITLGAAPVWLVR
jgi:hypothetical protein